MPMEVFSISGGSEHRLESPLTLCTNFSMQMMPLYRLIHPLASRTVWTLSRTLITEPAWP